MDEKPVILTCAQPTGGLTLGNYLGAVRNWSRMQADHECYFGIVDMHSITMPCVPAELRRNTLSCLAQYIACGLDPEKSHIFVQSHVIGHAELAWVLSCLTPLGELGCQTFCKCFRALLKQHIPTDQRVGYRSLVLWKTVY